ncbi:hypothetical protein BO85DRAFT_170286 [Aspergillus piperis CBS 112811]|uniref:Uncharacterized protein n=1 Tax=Aspergillus piperis CBS 112811 TaxID=1448313 RepID=A0A8G1VI76_9EURO|nr:hypothetical protein BO85DRAFT_170286 [Aspergillus piperis CBS 112811]RAH52972.1 hypothetical protein BO85DRAFT_170286 [Aspergillus piperis CBS 112811]
MGPCQFKIHGLHTLRRFGRRDQTQTIAFSRLIGVPPRFPCSICRLRSLHPPIYYYHTTPTRPPWGREKRASSLAFPAHLNSGLISHILLSKLQSCCSLNRAKRDGTNKKDMSCIAHNRWDLRANIWVEGNEKFKNQHKSPLSEYSWLCRKQPHTGT